VSGRGEGGESEAGESTGELIDSLNPARSHYILTGSAVPQGRLCPCAIFNRLHRFKKSKKIHEYFSMLIQ